MSARETILQPIIRSRTFLEECWSELKKVHFPTRKETQAATIVVVIGVLIVSAYLFVVDAVLSKLIGLFLV
jgi:preprotein translocase subunit SecE